MGGRKYFGTDGIRGRVGQGVISADFVLRLGNALGRVLVAQRAHAFGMQLYAYDPFVSEDRARQLGVKLVPTVAELVSICDFVSIHATKTPETVGLISAEKAWQPLQPV